MSTMLLAICCESCFNTNCAGRLCFSQKRAASSSQSSPLWISRRPVRPSPMSMFMMSIGFCRGGWSEPSVHGDVRPDVAGDCVLPADIRDADEPCDAKHPCGAPEPAWAFMRGGQTQRLTTPLDAGERQLMTERPQPPATTNPCPLRPPPVERLRAFELAVW